MLRPLSCFFPLALLLAGCEPQAGESAYNRFLERRAELQGELEICERGSGVQLVLSQARCMRFPVPENPAEPAGRQIELQVMQIPAIRGRSERDPLVILVGGPGQAATEAGVMIAQVLGQVRQQRDILLVDQRGTGELSPLDCDLEDEESALETDMPFILARQAEVLRACLSRLEARPEFYTTDIAVQDLERIRTYFGYGSLNLWGGSYGTRVALAYLQAYPRAVRTLVLDGVAPVAIKLPLYTTRDASDSFRRILELCREDADCAAAFPELESHYGELLARLETPRQVSLRESASGEALEFELNRDLFTPLLRLALYSREYARLLPLLIEEAWRGNYQMLGSMNPLAEQGINQAMFLSVICSEDLSRISAEELARELARDYLLDSELMVRPVVEACDIWPTRELDAGYFEPVVSNTPALILSGSLDPVTPPRWGELAAETLTNARHLVVQGVSHGVTPYGCAGALIAAFIETADPQAPDASCLENLRPRPFFLNWGGGAGISAPEAGGPAQADDD